MFVIQEAVVESQQFVTWHIAEDGGTNVPDEICVPLSPAIVIDDDLQEIRAGSEFVVAARGTEDRVERVDVFDVETDLEVRADGLHRGFHGGEHRVFAFVEEAVPRNNLRMLDK